MSSLALRYSRREWTIELLLLLAKSMLVWLIAAVALAPFSAKLVAIPPLLVIGLVGLASILPRLLHDRGIWGWQFSAVLIVAIALSTLATIKIIAFPGLSWFEKLWLRETGRSLVFEPSGADIVVWAPIGLSAMIWWLARFDGSPGLERSRAMLRTGAAAAAIATIGSSFVEDGPDDTWLVAAIIVFFAATLIALAIARQGGEATQSRRRFWSTVLLPTIVIGAVAILLALLVGIDWGHAIPHFWSGIGLVLDPVFTVLTLILTGIVFVIASPILWLLSLGNYEPPQFGDFGGFGNAEMTQSGVGWQPTDSVRYLLAAIVLVLIFYGVVRFGLSITRRDYDRTETGDREFGAGKGFAKWLERFRWPFGNDRTDPLVALRGDPAWKHTVRIREVYADWLRWSEKHAFGRHPAETALEFDRRVGRSLQPASSATLDELTNIYEDVRYGANPATSEQAERVEIIWRHLKSSQPFPPNQSS